MPELVTECPRCNASRITFDIRGAHVIDTHYDWQNWYEAFCICRHCSRATTFVLAESVDGNWEHLHKVGLLEIEGALNGYLEVKGFVSIKDHAATAAPDHLPAAIEAAFREGATCLVVSCPNAAATMFRLCVDLATRPMLPEEDAEGLTAKVRRDLGLRLPWLFAHGRLPEALRELSSCIKEDGNDGAHAGTLSLRDAEDLLDFTFVLIERIFTEPARLRLAQERRATRRSK